MDLTKYIEEHHFAFDNVYELDASNEQIYEECVQPLVYETFKGAKTTCFAYGQTGSGKTHTMMGKGTEVPGLYLMAAYEIMEELQNHPNIFIEVSFYEIYCGKLYDLLNNRENIVCREDGKQKVNIVGLTERGVASVDDIMNIISAGL